jgi:hypothetical protein
MSLKIHLLKISIVRFRQFYGSGINLQIKVMNLQISSKLQFQTQGGEEPSPENVSNCFLNYKFFYISKI